ncbi:mannose-1-phosphate guanylyltransferase/mannose-6-phosphate isomerase [Shimia sp. SDUM112013]|uniref:mannose-1-phosphate guanylyltransferase/mannose-6-phosphate isomerase n=1 Tax=Shimia sp. SDUM112013 TaxID=3136160 RepID=UPI0032F07148
MTKTGKAIITPVIMCGGSGTRLWPLSRKSFPKQFARLAGDQSLFQACARRMSGAQFAAPLVLTNSDFRFIVTEQLLDVGIEPGPVLIEPKGKNTAPAILAAALFLHDKDPDAVMLVAPSDHVVPDTATFHEAVDEGLRVVQEDNVLVTFGITPDRPETGYGYLELSSEPDGSGVAIPLKKFVEKPDAARAAQMLLDGNYLWNAGIFLFSVKSIITAFETLAGDLVPPVRNSVEKAEVDLGFLRLDPESWEASKDISIDYAVMEKASDLSVVPYNGTWSDLGSWEAVMREDTPDGNGVVMSGPVTSIDCIDTLLRSEDKDLELVGIGLENTLVVAMRDAVLVADMDRAQDVKLAVAALKEKSARQAESFAMDHRPWGHFETLALSDRFQVKRIVVKPGAALSLQSHVHRSEHWIVVEGTARVTVDDDIRLVSENESIYIPLGAVHRMENPGKVPMVLIEVQTGTYLGEDDIIRYEDLYARGQGAKG